MDGFKQEAAAQGISRQAIASALDGITFDPSVVRRDRGQGVFQQGFIQFAERMTIRGRYDNGLRQLKNNAALFARIEQRFGVPGPVVAALWGLESDYGAYKGGTFRIIQAVATLAYDCRRPAFFRKQLMDAVRIVERGDFRAEEMIGNWAGELGRPSSRRPTISSTASISTATGKVDMIRSVPDALASAANLMASFGWQRGQPWLQEVRVPAQMPWEQSGLDVKHPRSQWVRWGVTSAHGARCRRTGSRPRWSCRLAATGRRSWPIRISRPTPNGMRPSSTRPRPPISRPGWPAPRRSARAGSNVVVPTPDQVKELQRLLIARRFLTGEADGRLGSASRVAVKQAQIKLGLPADAYPTPELTERLKGIALKCTGA